ncbi:TRZ/ATZ family hydrolase [Halorhodospira halophila]|uniref:5-methylthioadenosine/S-adenosylhomocysteine deaminase n=1 Tax=Halorhodospira halophila (strain DSM 244 / SL1) TaxID=349124 RepID=A1WUJ8_HALHL|nr:TRZ/ATZ family hydrolase [Halorhodospira halophila]ABM61360.1 amidohydrolase [Halorhodospira halophila SL1]MBK1729057.1 N-ethylammeline chlorohydrolase [Halorhodospira halophila]
MERVDTLIHARWVIPVEPTGHVLEDHGVALRDGRIVAVAGNDDLRRAYQADEQRELGEHVLIPGLINAHTHTAMTLLRGMADDLPLMTWLTEHIWPAEQRWVSEAFVRDGSTLAMGEMLRGGVTCFNDMYFYPEVTGEAARQVGMRALLGMIVIGVPSGYAQSLDEYLEKGLALHEQFRDDPLVRTLFAPHSPYTVDDSFLGRIGEHAERLDVPIHIHVQETADEVQQSLRETGKRPLQRLDEVGLVSPRLLAVHATQLESAEIERLAAAGAHVLHCPEANLKLASGFCPAAALTRAGVNVALGTDGVASNNDLDLIGEMRTAALLAKAVSGDAAALPAEQALAMVTINAARAFGLDDEIGSIVPGKAADLTAISLADLNQHPIYNPLSQLVYAANRQHVTDVWVGGQPRVRNGQLTTLDTAETIARAEQWRERIAAERAQ